MNAIFFHRRPVRFRETDMAGLVHFTAVLGLVEEAWHEWLAAAGIAAHPSVAAVGTDALGWPVVSITGDFRASLRFGQIAEVRLEITRTGKSSLTLAFQIAPPGGAGASGTVTFVCAEQADDGTWHARNLPPALAEKLQAHSAPRTGDA